MIRAEFKLSDTQCELTVEGHADFDRHGHDIVCAAVSVLVAALICHVEDEAGCGADVLTEMRSGYAMVRAERSRCEAFRLVYRGLCRLACTYPMHVAVVTSEKAWEASKNKEETT